MPVFIYDEDAFEKMIEVEGERYRRYKTKEEFGVCSFDAFKEYWDKNIKGNPKLEKCESGISVDSNGAIYGYGGWTRYVVLMTGEICFLPHFDPSVGGRLTEKAKEVGFRLM